MGVLSLEPNRSPPTEIDRNRCIGKGSFGEVCEHRNAATGETRAVKILCLEKLLFTYRSFRLTSNKILEEVEHNSKLINKDGIVQFHSYWMVGPNGKEILEGTHEFPRDSSSGQGPLPGTDFNFLFIEMELFETTMGNLIDRLLIPDNWELEDVFHPQSVPVILAQLCKGLVGIHDAGIIHRDVHPGNIFIKKRNGIFIWKIGDFGLSREWIPEDKSSRKGCEMYRSPEMARGDKDYLYKTDVFSFGLVSLLLLYPDLRCDPGKRNEVFNNLRVFPSERKHEVDPIKTMSDNISQDLQVEWDIVRRMLEFDVAKRIDSFEASKRFMESLQDLCNTDGIQNHNNFPTHFPSKENTTVSGSFVKRENIVSEIVTLIVGSSPDVLLPVITITGPGSVGKTKTVKRILHELKETHSSVWIDCCDVVKNWKSFLLEGNEMSKDWIIVFDSAEKCEGVVQLMLESLANIYVSSVKPKAVLVTTTLEPLEIPNTHGIKIPLQFEWVVDIISQNNPPRYFLTGIFKEVTKSTTKLSKDTSIRDTCTMLVGLIKKIEVALAKGKETRNVWDVVFNLIVLVGHLQNVSVNKAEFIYYISLISGATEDMCVKIVEILCQGILTETEPELGDDLTEEEEYEKTAKYTEIDLSRLHPICSKLLLQHPLVLFILRNVLTQPYEGELELTFCKRSLITYKSIAEKGELGKIAALHYAISFKIAKAMVGYTELVYEHAAELVVFARDVDDFTLLQKLYIRFEEKFRVIGKPTLGLSEILMSHLESINPNNRPVDPNAILEYKVKEYDGYVEQFGASDKETLFTGGLLYLHFLLIHKNNELLDKKKYARICMNIYNGLEEYLLGLENIEEADTGVIRFEKEEEIFKCLLLLAEAFGYVYETSQAALDVCAVRLSFTDYFVYVERVEQILKDIAERRNLIFGFGGEGAPFRYIICSDDEL